MQVHSPLLTEHAVIRRMMDVIDKFRCPIRGAGQWIEVHLDSIMDFLCMYVDRCHHAKEEDIFLHHLEKKEIHESDRKVMEELLQGHVFIMKSVGEIIDAQSSLLSGDEAAGAAIDEKFGILTASYVAHMKMENEIFFPKVLKYFSYQEQNSVLHEFWRFNEKIPLEKYHATLHQLEALTGTASHPSIRLFHSS